MEALVETIEDLQLRAFKQIQLFNGTEKQSQFLANKNRCFASSSRYGICLALGPNRQLYSMLNLDIHKIGIGSEKLTSANFKYRTIQYYNQQAELSSIAVNSDGSILSVVIQTSNGPFVDIYDIECFDPKTEKQPFPLLSIRMSSNNTAQLRELEWNPTEADLFAAITTDSTVTTVRCTAIQDGSNSKSCNFSTMNIHGALCLSWSPKGKQLVVGDNEGRIHQLKPELNGPAVRQIEPPQDIPTFAPQSLACTAICWLSTTEWLVAYQPRNAMQTQPPNISLLVVKKQQPPKWFHYGDVLATARQGRLTFCPFFDWHMVFLYSPDCTQVGVFAQRGEQWRKLEFETYDIEMPLASDGRSNTFPIGATLEFTSTTPLILDQGAERMQFAPTPMLHLLNSEGQLLPYAIVSLISGNEQRPTLNKAPEPIQIGNARFGQPPPGWAPPPPTMAITTSTPPQTQFHTPKTQPNAIQFQTPPNQQTPFQVPKTASATSSSTATTLDANKIDAAQQAEKIRVEEEKQAQYQKKQREKSEAEEQQRRLDALEKALERSIVDYTSLRNRQALKVEKLHQLRCEIERQSTSLDLGHFDKLLSIRNELLEGLRQKSRVLDSFCKKMQQSADALNQLKLYYDDSKNRMKEHRQPSFDIQKRLELVKSRYDKTLNDFERAKRMLKKLDEQHFYNFGLQRVSCEEVIDPLEQRKLIQTNDNIAKMCTKLAVRLQQIQRQMEVQKANGRRDTFENVSRAKPVASTSSKDSDIADFCVLELGQLDIEESGDKMAFDANTSAAGGSEFQRDLYNCLTNLDQYKTSKPLPIRLINPLRPTMQPEQRQQKTPTATDEPALARKMNEIFTTPQKPQLVSVGVQSPDFMIQKTDKDKATPAKTTALKHSTPVVAKPSSTTILTKPSVTSANVCGGNTIFTGSNGRGMASVTTTSTTSSIFSTASISTLPAIKTTAQPIVRPAQFAFKTQEGTAISTTPSNAPAPIKSTQSNAPNAVTAISSTSQTIAPVIATTMPEPQKQPVPVFPVETAKLAPTTATPIVPVGQAPFPAPGIAGEEGMEDEMAPTATAVPAAVNFDFKSFGLGATSTPISAANRNPFGSITPTTAAQGASPASGGLFGTSASGSLGSSAFGTPASTFGTPNRSSAFGSFGTGASAASPPSTGFGASPFASGSAFGGAPSFGTTSPFASATKPSAFGSSLFGGGNGTTTSATGGAGSTAAMGGTGSLFGGGGFAGAGVGQTTGAAAGGGFSAFASKSTAFGQLANQAQQGTTTGASSLFGGGTAPTGGSGLSSVSGSSSFGGGTQKNSAFTTFRK